MLLPKNFTSKRKCAFFFPYCSLYISSCYDKKILFHCQLRAPLVHDHCCHSRNLNVLFRRDTVSCKSHLGVKGLNNKSPILIFDKLDVQRVKN